MGIIRESEQEPPGTDSDAGSNGQGPTEDAYTAPDFNLIFGAPDFTTLIRRPQTAGAKKYTRDVSSVLKAFAMGALQAGNYPDTATILYHGPGFATALGDLADSNDYVGKAVDLLTSPSSPLITFILATAPLISQLARNHETQIQQIPSRFSMRKRAREQRKVIRAAEKAAQEPTKPLFTIKAFGRQIPVHMRVPRSRLMSAYIGSVRAQSLDPNFLAQQVLSDLAVQKAFEKSGVVFRTVNDAGK